MKYVNHPVPKKDAMALVTGKPVYTDDLAQNFNSIFFSFHSVNIILRKS